MTDTLWSDISEFQVPVTDAYSYRFLCLRSNDGTYEDHHFTQNIAWARAAVKSGRLWGFMVYYFYRPGVDGARVLMGRVGKPDPQMTVMIDVESDGGRVSGNQSATINAQHDELARWLGSAKRVVGYGGVANLNALWPSKPPGLRIVVAAYGSNPDYPGKFAHQFTDSANTPPFGPSDLNSADGMSAADLQHMFGLADAQPQPPAQPTSYQLGGYESVRAFAHNHGMSVQEVLWLTARHKDGGYGKDQGGYISAGHWDEWVPKGSTWWAGPTP
jgi:hypothetical protein